MERARKGEGWCHQDPAQALGMDGGEETPTTSVCVWEDQNLSVSPCSHRLPSPLSTGPSQKNPGNSCIEVNLFRFGSGRRGQTVDRKKDSSWRAGTVNASQPLLLEFPVR